MPISLPQISNINAKHRQKAVISPYSRTLPTYNAHSQSGYWQHPPPVSGFWPTQVTESIVSQPPPPLPPMPPISEADVPMPPPPPSTTPPPLQPDEKLVGRTNQQRKDQGKNCNSISFKIASKSSPAISYVNNIPRSQSSTHLKYNHNTSMTNSSNGSTNSLSENNLLLKTVAKFDGGLFNGYPAEGLESFGVPSMNLHERGEFVLNKLKMGFSLMICGCGNVFFICVVC